jgi:prepilin-type N-terminal cleavage/methylation domain-containing protein
VHRVRRRTCGFSLIELMVVVVILSVLAAIAAVGYRRYVAKARSTEAVAMLAEMSAKEQVYFLEFAQFLPLVSGTTITAALATGNATENSAQFWPSDPGTSTFDSVRVGTAVTNPLPLSWQYVAIRPKDNVLYCTYFASAGLSGSAPVAGSLGAGLLGSTAIAQPWYYVLGSCNLRGTSSFPSGVTSFVLTFNSPTLKTLNEGQ